MPLTPKGKKILNNMEETYGSKDKAEQVFYASANAGKITGIEAKPKKKKTGGRRKKG